MIQCHNCQQAFEKVDYSCIAKCCIKRCNKYYCIECIKKHFNPEFDMQMYKKDTWICYSCQSICHCDKCKKPEKQDKTDKPQKSQSNNDKKSNKKKGKPKGNDQSIENSASNISQNNAKIETANLPNLQQEEPNIILNEEDQQEAMQDEPVPEFKLYTEDQMYGFPPFYRKIAERRNKFYSFILKEWRKKKPISKISKHFEKSQLKQKQKNE